jgi:hypothetical protein
MVGHIYLVCQGEYFLISWLRPAMWDAFLLVWSDMILRVSRTANLKLRQDIADRFERGETQVKIAKDLGISPASVRYYLRLAGVPGAVRPLLSDTDLYI